MEKRYFFKSKRANSCFEFLYSPNLINSKHSQTNIIVAVLVVFIVLVVVLIVWNVVSPLVGERGEEIEETGEAFGITLEAKEAMVFVTGTSKVIVERKAGGGEMSALKFVFYDESDNIRVETKKDDLPNPLETKTYHFFPLPDFGKIQRVRVFPMVDGATGLESGTEINEILEIPSGLVSWWRFDGNAEDFIGNNDGGVYGVTFVEEGRSFVSFNKESYINFGNNVEFDFTDAMSISFWIRTDNYQGEIIKKGDGNKNYGISLNSEGEVVFSHTSSGVLSSVTGAALEDGWNHVVVSIDWSSDGTGDDYVRIYLNGEPTVGEMPSFPDTSLGNVLVGENFKGDLDEIMVFERALFIHEVNALYQNQK